MKRLVFLALAALGAIGCGPRTGASWDGDDPDLLVRWHFAGTAQLAGNTNGAALRAVLAEPATRTLISQTLERLAAAPVTRPLAPLLSDLIEAESFVEARGQPARPEWTFAVRVSSERAALWLNTWSNTAPAWERAQAQVERAGEWILAAAGDPPLAGLQAVQRRLKQTGRPAPHSEPGAWLEVEARLDRLALAWGLPTNLTWPHAHLALAGQGEHLRTVGRFTWPQPLACPLEPWRLPTNTISEPLISFAALQGVRPWLAAHPLVRELDLPPPNQLFWWGRSLAPFLTQFAWEMPEATTRLPALQGRLPAALRARLDWLDFGEVQLVPRLSRLAWTGFPMVVPFVNPAPDPGFVTAGIFPLDAPTEPAPPELYAQLRGRTNLVFYHWEVTPPRVADWQELRMLYDMVAGHAPPPTNSPARRWLQDTNVTRHLGNAVTEMTLTSPQELTLVRRSAVGLTAFELHALARWLEGRRFPLFSPPVRLLRPAKAAAAASETASPVPPALPADHAQTGRQH